MEENKTHTVREPCWATPGLLKRRRSMESWAQEESHLKGGVNAGGLEDVDKQR